MDDIISMKTMLEDFNELIDPAKSSVSSVWSKVVSRIKSIKDEDSEISMGEKIAQNTHVVDLKKGVLLVEAKHSGWIQYLRMYQKFILKGLAMECPELQIKTLAFRTRGSDVSLFDGYEEQLEKSLQKRKEEIEKSEKEINNFFENSKDSKALQAKTEKKEINPDLKEKIAGLYDTFNETMLTNSKK